MVIKEKCPTCHSDNIIIKMCGDYKQFFVCLCGDCDYTPVPISKGALSPHKAIKYWNKYCKNMKLCRDCDGKSHHPRLVSCDVLNLSIYKCPKCNKLWNMHEDE